jgi:hypothetical protein
MRQLKVKKERPSWTTYYFDERNKLMKSVQQSGGGGWAESSFTNIYDEDGNMIESISNSLGYSRTKWEYNKDNQLVGRTVFNKSGEIESSQSFDRKPITSIKDKPKEEEKDGISVEYEYDEVGNWTKKKVFQNDIEIRMYERRYIYRKTSL